VALTPEISKSINTKFLILEVSEVSVFIIRFPSSPNLGFISLANYNSVSNKTDLPLINIFVILKTSIFSDEYDRIWLTLPWVWKLSISANYSFASWLTQVYLVPPFPGM
jgi:hypothetical protein